MDTYIDNKINLDIFKRNIQLHILGIDSLDYRDKLLGGLKTYMNKTNLIHLTIWLLKLRYNLDMVSFSTFEPLETRISDLKEI